MQYMYELKPFPLYLVYHAFFDINFISILVAKYEKLHYYVTYKDY